jgi:endonuclease/exonuclease/phosphatase family metal-dependent hydrolase
MQCAISPKKKTLKSHRRVFIASFIALLTCVLLSGTAPGRTAPVNSEKKLKLRVMTYNIHVGVGMDKRMDLQRIADVINQEHPDLVGLQEVDRGVKRTQGVDEIAELARMTQMEFAFAHNLDYQGGQYGVAILSRFPILKTDHRMYLNKREAERRGMLRIEATSGGHSFSFATTHLDYQYEDGRIFEAGQLLDFLKVEKGPLILVGDFNVDPTGDSYKLIAAYFRDAWLETNQNEKGLSYPADHPVKRIDYIFYRANSGPRAKKAWTVDTQASDHIPVMADLEIR